MVLAKLYTDRVRAEAWAKGYERGKAEALAQAYEESKAEGYEIGYQEGYEIGYAIGFREGERRMMARWQGWNARRKQAERAGLPFTEPEP